MTATNGGRCRAPASGCCSPPSTRARWSSRCRRWSAAFTRACWNLSGSSSSYMIASTVLVLSAGRFSDLFGRKRAYIAGFVVFAAASLGAGFAGSGTELIIWRVVQGIGGALLFANAPAIVTDAFPSHQLGVAMGTNTMIAAVGLVLGPVLGGALVAIAWQWVFWFNVPLSIAGAVWAALVLHETRAARHRTRARSPWRLDLSHRPHRLCVRDLSRRPVRLERPAGDRGVRGSGGAAAPLRRHRGASTRADAGPHACFATGCSQRRAGRRSSTACLALR